ncbi:hypothetical protein NMG60_11000979 [Bertholletia excelsa]
MEMEKNLFLQLYFLVLLLGSTQCFANEQFIRDTCSKTRNFNLCVSTLKSDPASQNADGKGLAKIALNIELNKVQNALKIVGDLLAKTTDPALFKKLGTCIEEYRALTERELPAAIKDIDSGNFGDAKQASLDVATNADVCQNQFVSGTSPVAAQNKELDGLAPVVADIISTLG